MMNRFPDAFRGTWQEAAQGQFWGGGGLGGQEYLELIKRRAVHVPKIFSTCQANRPAQITATLSNKPDGP